MSETERLHLIGNHAIRAMQILRFRGDLRHVDGSLEKIHFLASTTDQFISHNLASLSELEPLPKNQIAPSL